MTTQDLTARAQQVQHFQPMTPVQAEQRIVEANDLLEALVEAQNDANDRRYEAEANYLLKRNSRMAELGKEGLGATFARAQAEVEAAEAYRSWLDTKAEYHHLEGLSQALRTRIYSWLNLNKSVQAAYNSYRGP
ncbi:MAG: hypothetical protein ACK5LO_02475 [Leucobacter sp.]